MTPDVSVVIVTYNSRAVVGDAIRSIQQHTHGVTFEIIVVDNASADDTGAFVAIEHSDVRVLHLPRNVGLSAAINDGVTASTGRQIMQINPDCVLTSDAISLLSQYLDAHPDVGVAAPKLLNDDGSTQLSCRAFPGYSTALFNRYSLLTKLWRGNPVSRRYLMTDFDHAVERDVDWASAAAMMFPRTVFDRIRGWDSGFFLFSEDVDFCRRVHNAGLGVVYVPDACVQHTIGISERPTVRAVIERHRSMWRYYRKHIRRSALTDIVTAPAITVRLLFALAGTGVRSLRSQRATRP
jgi:GT2 family glycosyltransferase